MLEKIKSKIYQLLRRSEKYTQTDMVYLAKGGFWLTLGQVVSFASAFLLAIAFANLLPKETFGVYKYVLSVCGILAIPALQGMGTAVAQAVARGYEGSFIPALKTKIRWGLLGGLAGLILAGYYYLQANSTLTIAFLISAAFLPFMDSFGIYDAFLQGRKLFGILTKYGIISQIIAVSALITTIFFTKHLFLILLAYFISWTLCRFVFLKITLKKFPLNQNQDPQTISYGKHLSLIGVIGTIAAYLDRLLIFHYLGAAEVAVYSFAIAPPEQLKAVLKNIHFLALPKFAQREKEEIRKTIFKKVFKFFLFLLPVVVAYILAAPFLYKIFFPKYLESIFYSQLFALSLITAVAVLPYSALQSQMAKKELYLYNTWAPVIQIIFLFVFIYFYGLLGAILARVISRFINLGISFWLIKKI